MFKKLNHIGIAVKSVDESVKFFEENFGAELITRLEFPAIRQISVIVKIGDSHLELMEGTAEDSVISKFVAEKGEGLHHLSLAVDNIEKTCDELEKKEMRIIGKNLAMKMAFVHPKSVHGILLELTEL